MTGQARAGYPGSGDRTDQRSSEFARRGLPFWLPPGGRGNGFVAESWTMLVELDEADLIHAVSALTAAHIAVYVTRVRLHERTGSGGRRTRSKRRQVPARYVVWVDSLHHAAAEGILMSVLAPTREDRSDTGHPVR